MATGETSYEITAVTPIFVDDGTEEFYRNAKGEFTIPGSTIRGLIRNNVQMLVLAGYIRNVNGKYYIYKTQVNSI